MLKQWICWNTLAEEYIQLCLVLIVVFQTFYLLQTKVSVSRLTKPVRIGCSSIRVWNQSELDVPPSGCGTSQNWMFLHQGVEPVRDRCSSIRVWNQSEIDVPPSGCGTSQNWMFLHQGVEPVRIGCSSIRVWNQSELDVPPSGCGTSQK